MRNNTRDDAMRETAKRVKDDGRRLSDLETKEIPVAATFATTSTYSPVITGSVSNPTVTYTEQVGKYTVLFNAICFFSLRAIINTISGGSGDLRVSIPFTAANTNNADATRNGLTLSNVDITVTGYNAVLRVANGNAYATCVIAVDNAGVNTAQISDFSNGDGINASGFFWI